MSNLALSTEGRRIYITGNTYSAKDAIKGIGGKWDADRKAWWVASVKKAEAEALIGGAVAAPSSAEGKKAPGEDAVVAGKATYKGKTYYIAGRVNRGRTHWDDTVSVVSSSAGKMLLYSMDASMEFWAADAEIIKKYEKGQTIGGLARFAERNKREAAQTGIDCPVCRREEARGNLRQHLHDGCDACGAEG